jgi:hypothetical protein
MLTPGDFHSPEVVDLEEEADRRGYYATDEDDPDDAGESSRRSGPTVGFRVSSRRR